MISEHFEFKYLLHQTVLFATQYWGPRWWENISEISLICDKIVTTQNLTFFSYWYRKKRLQMHF